MTGRNRVVLKLLAQREYNTYLYGALPLCVILANGLSPWFLERYVQTYSCYLHDIDVPLLDMCDAFAYSEVLDTVTFDRTSVADRDIIDLLRDAVAAGRYATVFVDTNYLWGLTSSAFVHEWLAYGFDDTARQVYLVGFATDRRFTTHRVDYQMFRTAFDRGVTATAPDGLYSVVTSLVQLLTPRHETYHFNPREFTARLRGYRDSTPVPLSAQAVAATYWWMADIPDYSLVAASRDPERVRYGMASYQDLDTYLSRAADRPDRPGTKIDYRVFHLVAEHKQSVMRRLEVIAESTGRPAELRPLLSGWRRLAQQAETLRLGVLRRNLVDDPVIPAHAAGTIREMRTAETELLDGLCDVLDRVI